MIASHPAAHMQQGSSQSLEEQSQVLRLPKLRLLKAIEGPFTGLLIGSVWFSGEASGVWSGHSRLVKVPLPSGSKGSALRQKALPIKVLTQEAGLNRGGLA